MSGSASLDLERSLLQHTLAIAPMPALGRVYVALCLSAPTETAGGTEASGGGYARAGATFALMASPSNAASNATSVEFLAATSAWGTVGYFEIWTQPTGGTRLYWGPLTDPADGVPIEMDVTAGDVVRFSAGALIIQSAEVSTATGGPWLPIAGGVMTGSIRGSDDQNLGVGGSFEGYSVFSSAIGGVRTGGDWQLSGIATTSDTLDAGAGGFVGQYIHLVSGGTGTSGNRIGQYIDTYFSGSTLDGARGYPSQYGGQWIYAHASGNTGGTALTASRGQLWGGLSSATLQSGATFWSYCISHEFNLGVSAGASAAFVQGIKIAIQNHNQINDPGRDFLFGMSRVALSDEPFFNGMVFGTVDGHWPIRPLGTLIGTQATVLPTPPPYTAAYGVDLNAVTFSQAAFRSTNFLVSGAGHVSANGVDCGSRIATGQTDYTKHVALYGGSHYINVTGDSSINYTTGGAHMFWVGATRIGYMSGAGLSIDTAISATNQLGVGGVTWTTGSAAPTATAPVGSLYSREGGAVGATLYVSRGGGTWAAVAGV